MRRLLVVLLVLLPLCGWAQKVPTRAEKFLSQYQLFVDEVTSYPFEAFHGDTLVKVQRTERRFLRRYRWYYQKRLSVDQLEEFNKHRGRYRRKLTALNNRRRMAALRGRIEGFFYRDSTRHDTRVLDTVAIE